MPGLMRCWVAAGALGGLLACVAGASAAAQPDEGQVWDDVGRAALKGPADVPLLDQAVLHVPAGAVFVPQPQADRLLDLFGSPGRSPGMPGLLLPRDPRARWYMAVRFHQAGHVRDDDARRWDADEMLRSLRLGAREHDRVGETSGPAGGAVEGWSEPPRYDAVHRRLVWALTIREIDATTPARRRVEFNAIALGREGYFRMNVETALADLPALQPVAEQQLAGLEFLPGKRYADFEARTDRLAPFGLRALVADVAPRPAGLVARAKGLLASATPLMMAEGGAAAAALLAIVVGARRRRAAPARTQS